MGHAKHNMLADELYEPKDTAGNERVASCFATHLNYMVERLNWKEALERQAI